MLHYSCYGYTTDNPIWSRSLPVLLTASHEQPVKLQQLFLVIPDLSAGQYLQFVSQHPFQGQQGELCGERIRQPCNPPLSKSTVNTLLPCETHRATLSCCNRLRKVTGALYPHILTLSPLSARKGSVSCGSWWWCGCQCWWTHSSRVNILLWTLITSTGFSCTYVAQLHVTTLSPL